MNKHIYLSLAHMGGSEQKYIQEAFDTNWVVPLGPNVDAFEQQLEQYLDTEKKIVALSSGTAAIHLGLLQLGVKAGDEVICQSFTFSASANPVTYLGAHPVFVDSEPDTWNMSPVFLEEAITDRIKKTGKKPKAIIPVHLYGMPAKMDEITATAQKYDIPVLEDSAEALGSTYKNRKCGTFGNFACLSFNGNKIITTSGGGALVCSSVQEAEKTKFYATQARDKAPHYQHSEIGYNYRMSNICAGIGRGQMEVLTERVLRRREINGIYRRAFENVEGISLQTEPDKDFQSNCWLTAITVEPSQTGGITCEDIRLACNAADVETRPLWKPMHLQPVFKNCPFYGDGASGMLFEKGLCLPSGTSLADSDIQYVIKCVKATVNRDKLLLLNRLKTE
ncbi:MAG: aminotransferase class I/II-fold pyridoxal phosphate-dependent enzyme [Bacteroidales bacterium]|jgi:dTDP-4-amino-4,6-dideoxygalactose transaminase|nr:aminotransferase class I/II-fold pyridoxal phosphate-dependent enzyme [Bacteroidales bacterium]